MMITVITMGSTKGIIQTKHLRYGLGIAYAILGLCAVLNLFFTLTPAAKSNALLDDQIQAWANDGIPAPDIAATEAAQQERNLTRIPSDPFSWARLTRLRLAAKENPKAAFEALRMADLVSPYESAQLPERAVMWRQFRNYETPEQRLYQDTLWVRSYGMQRDLTWDYALRSGLSREAGDALHHNNPALYEEWKYRETHKP
jgi:hypothetical protein